MTPTSDSDLRIRAWMRDEPAGALPGDSLVEGVLERVRRSSPRPLLLVATTRPSSVLVPATARRSVITPAVLAAMLALALLAGAAASGAIRWVADRPVPLPSHLAIRSIAPSPTPPASATPFRPHVADLGSIGVRIWIPNEQVAGPIVGRDGVAVLFVSSFPADVQELRFSRDTNARGAILGFGATTAGQIACATPAAMADQAVASLGWTDSHRRSMTVDGLDAIWVQAEVDAIVRIVVAVERPDGCLLITSEMRHRPAIPELDMPEGDGGARAFEAFLSDVRIDRPGPTPSPTPIPTPAPSSQVALSEMGGFSVRCPGSWVAWQFPYGQPEEPGLSLAVTPFLVADIPTELIVIRFTGPDGTITLPDQAGVERHLYIDSQASLQQATRLGMGLQPAERVDVDGVPGLAVMDGDPTLLVFHDGRAYVVTVGRFLANGSRATLQTVIDGWRWTD